MKKVLVTGGAGFIGSALVQNLCEKGYQVDVFDNLSFGKKEHLPQNVKLILGDIRSEADLMKLDCEYEDIYHLAAIHFIPYCNEHPKETLDINIEGTRCLLSHIEHHQKKCKKLFFATTAAVYNASSDVHMESELPEPMDIYGISKLAGEHLCKNFSKKTGVRVFGGRLFNAYGPNETNAHLIPHIVDQLKVQKEKASKVLQLGNLEPFRDYVHTEDMVYMISEGLANSSQPFVLANIGSGHEYSVSQVVNVFSKLLNCQIQIESKSEFQRKSERAHLRPNIETIRKKLNVYQTRSFEEGIQMLLRQEGLLK